MDFKGQFQSLRDAGKKGLDEKSHAAIEEHWPKIQQLFREKVGPAAVAAAHNDQQMESTFKMVYSALPFPIRMAIKEEIFIKFCFEHRDGLLPSLEASAGS